MHNYHNLVNAHASSHSGDPGYFPIYPEIQCVGDYLASPEKTICSGWIRPEDVEVYRESGFQHFKLDGRLASSDAILRIAEAYLVGRLDGNFFDLFFHYLTSERLREVLGRFLDNRELDGFIEPFAAGKMDCTLCSGDHAHCRQYARKMRIDSGNLEAAKQQCLRGILAYLKERAPDGVP